MASNSPGTTNNTFIERSVMESRRHDSDSGKADAIFGDARYAGPLRYCVLEKWDPLSRLLTCTQDVRLLPAVKAIARLPEIDKTFNEDIKAAERALHFKGLLIDRQYWTELGASIEMSPWLDVAHHIKETFLEPAKRQHPLPLRLVLDHPPDDDGTDETLQIDVMPRTTLTFFVLACHLRTTIVVFSSRTRPQVYDPPSSNGVIALFHAIDAPEKISRFEVLKFRMDKLIQWASPGSAPQQQPILDCPSITLASVAARSLVKPEPPVEDDTNNTSGNKESDSNIFTPFASYRPLIDRKQLRRHPNAITEEAKDQCKVQYHIACKEYIQERVTKELKDAVKDSKKRKIGSVEDCMSNESKVRIRDKITAKQRAPPGPFDKGYARTITLPGLENLTKQDVRNRQGTGFCKSEYNATLETVYEGSWREAVFLCRKELSLPDPATTMKPDPGEGSSAMQMDVDGVVDGGKEDESGPLTHEEESAIAREGKDRQERHCYTFPMSLNQAIAFSLTEHADIVADLCKSKQIALTNMADELFALVMKTTLLLADQRGRRPSSPAAGAGSAPPNTFDVKILFPEDFQPRCAASSTLFVSPIPDGLEELLVPRPNETMDPWTNDLRNLLGYEHLGYLYARFLGPDGAPASSSEKHPLWTHLANLIESQDGASRIYPPGRTTDAGDHPLLGLSNLVCEIRHEMATNIANLWAGPLYNKAVDYLLRFSLRFRLAGLRESKYHTARLAAADKKSMDKDKPKRYTRKAWKDDIEKSQNIFGKELRQLRDGSMDQERYQHLMSFLYRHARSEPGRGPKNLSFQDRLANPEVLLEMMGTPAPYEDLEEEEDIAEQEKEQEERESSSDLSMAVKEPTRAHLKSIQAVTRMLLESPSLQGAMSVDRVRACFHRPELVTDVECDAVIDTVNALRGYVPKRQLKASGGTAPPAQHVATMVGVVLIANQVVRIGGYPDFTMKIAPSPSVGSLHALPLGPAGLYEALCSSTKGHFDPHVSEDTVVSSVPKARSHANALFECFFDMDLIRALCKKYNVVFANRLTYVDKHTIHILGDVIPAGQERGTGAPVRSELEEERKKRGSKGTRRIDWSREGERIGVTQEIAKERAKQAQDRLSSLEADQKNRRKAYLQAERERSDASRIVKELSNGVDDSVDPTRQNQAWHKAYDELYQNRRAASQAWNDWAQHQDGLKSTRSEVYAFNKLSKTKPSSEPAAPPRRTIITWEQPALEDRTESLYLNDIFETARADSNKAFGFSSDDPGLSTMQVSATLTHGQASRYIRRYFETPNPFGALADYEMLEIDNESESQSEEVVDLPPITRITAPLLDDLTFSRKHAKSREQDLAADCDVSKAARAAVQRLSDTPISTATTLDEVNAAQSVRREARQDLRTFFSSNKRRRQAKTQRLRTKRTYSTLAALQRRGIKTEVQKEIRQRLKAKTIERDAELHEMGGEGPSTTDSKDMKDNDPEKVQILPIILHGTGGSCVGSRLKGHSKRGGGKMCNEHRQYGVVAHTNEQRTSQLCSACFRPVELARATRAQNGEVKQVRLHGAVVCRNRDCPRFKAKKATQGRDSNAAVNIAVAGSSNLLSSNKITLAPFRPFRLPPNNNNSSNSAGSSFLPSATNSGSPVGLVHFS